MNHILMAATSSSTSIAAVPSLPSPVVLAYIAAAILFILTAATLYFSYFYLGCHAANQLVHTFVRLFQAIYYQDHAASRRYQSFYSQTVYRHQYNFRYPQRIAGLLSAKSLLILFG